jgi:hypothetical protein
MYVSTDRTHCRGRFIIFLQPEDAKEAARDVLARAQAKGLLHNKKSKHNILENGEVHDTQSG